jgi:flagellar basal-body rod protein FlgG
MIEPAISVPSDAKRVMIRPDGLVLMERAGSKKLEAWGKFQLASFARPDALRPCGEHVFAMTEASGPPDTFEASPDRVTVMQRMLDARFVDARR